MCTTSRIERLLLFSELTGRPIIDAIFLKLNLPIFVARSLTIEKPNHESSMFNSCIYRRLHELDVSNKPT